MTRHQRNAVAVAAGLAAAFLLALLLAAVVDGDADEELTTDLTATTTSAPDGTTTTTGLDLPTTTAAPTTTTTTTGATTTTTRPKPVVDGRGAVLRPPNAPARRAMQHDDCTTLAAPGWTAECDHVTPGLVWLVETRSAAGGATARRVAVLREEPGDMWATVVETRDDDGSRFTDVNVRVEDLSGDGTPEAAVGFRRSGSSQVLALDVVDAAGAVVVHRESPDGSARVSAGQLDVWEAAGTAYDHLTIRYVDGAWRIVATTKVERTAIPPSHF